MYQKLKSLKETKKLVEIHYRYDDEYFDVGKIKYVNEACFILEEYAKDGKFYGYSLHQVDNIIYIVEDSKYVNCRNKLVLDQNESIPDLKLSEEKLLLDYLEYIKTNKLICSITLEETEEYISGYIKDFNGYESIELIALDSNAKEVGTIFVRLNDARNFIILGREEKMLEKLSKK